MAWFGAFRGHYGFSWYGDNRTSATVDIPLAAVTYFCVLVSIATIIASLGIRGKDRWSMVLRSIYGLTIGSIILVGLYSHSWQTGRVQVTTPYVYRSALEFRGTVGIKVALHEANITLEGYFGTQQSKGYVMYTEALPWSKFGQEHAAFEGMVGRGLPHPILRVAEHLCTDTGGLRWGKKFHIAGNFASALLWTSFAFWVVTSVLLFSVISYGAYMFLLTGVSMTLSCIVYHTCQPRNNLSITFGDQVLTMQYSWSFWLVLVAGVITLVLGVLLITLEQLFPKRISEFFAVDTGIEDGKGDYPTYSSPNGQAGIGDSPRRGSIFQDKYHLGKLYHHTVSQTGVLGAFPWKHGAFGNTRGSRFFLNKCYLPDNPDAVKCNPIFNETYDILEEEVTNTESKESSDVRIDMEDDVTASTSGTDRNSTLFSSRTDGDTDYSETQTGASVMVNNSSSGNESGCVPSRDSDKACDVMRDCSSSGETEHSNKGYMSD